MTLSALATWIACAGSIAGLAGCATNDQGLLVVDPNKVTAVVAAVLAPPPPVIVETAYQPVPTDVYVAGIADRDVVFIGGDTFIWVVGPNGQRHRQFYAHGDHRSDVFHRRDQLHSVMAEHGGHLPEHAIAAHDAGGHAGGAEHGGMNGDHHAMAGNAPGAHGAAPGKSAPPAKSDKKEKKT
ncbi:hypothetical protein [Paraburkholderia sp.]|uniref:hypothetical protein n=1 Tax=Paraburkholderia sp. TaxID=1926495 RepID=UPI00238F7133|nr:hypothetical protein [Paraburkholderia sp.]MDE1180456.1 hypothetical protein [Paraburkholderia sp.]